MAKRRKKIIVSLITILFSLVLLAIGYYLFDQFVGANYSLHGVSGSSMESELEDRDLVLVKMNAPLNRYSIIAFTYEEEMYVKRIIGVPGDSIIISQNRISIDAGGQGSFKTVYDFELSETVANELQNVMQIPVNSYFVIGDNLDISKDSREFGLISQNTIEGKIIFNFK
ncbi:signal peptidase I [Enterococcus faecalis]|uniref:signal peptidase I n=1 Tax=Enterococcus faecalis TaxID=1351 RepID=UPI001A063BC4|nr:signal peptidase I [Enterococcus faecalis]EGO6705155.1 signal peptidase I [Enterococcus faecalis]